jgi:hypothetical protein
MKQLLGVKARNRKMKAHLWKLMVLIPVGYLLYGWAQNIVATSPNTSFGAAFCEIFFALWMGFIALLPTILVIAIIYRLFKGFK